MNRPGQTSSLNSQYESKISDSTRPDIHQSFQQSALRNLMPDFSHSSPKTQIVTRPPQPHQRNFQPKKPQSPAGNAVVRKYEGPNNSPLVVPAKQMQNGNDPSSIRPSVYNYNNLLPPPSKSSIGRLQQSGNDQPSVRPSGYNYNNLLPPPSKSSYIAFDSYRSPAVGVPHQQAPLVGTPSRKDNYLGTTQIQANIGNLAPDYTKTMFQEVKAEPPKYALPSPVPSPGSPALGQVPNQLAGLLDDKQKMIVQQLKYLYEKNNPLELVQPVTKVLNQLELKYQRNDLRDVIELGNIACLILKYPSQKLAEVHRNANKLGPFDIDESGKAKQGANMCPCCKLVEQKSDLPMQTSLDSLKHIGVSNHLYFFTIDHLKLLMLILLLVFCVTAAGTNLKASSLYQQEMNGKEVLASLKSYSGIIATSIGSKELFHNDFTSYTISLQCWLGLLTIVLWIGAFIYIHYKYLDKQSQVDYDSATIADYTLLFKDMPRGIKKEDLESQLQMYQKEMREKHPQLFTSLMEKEIKIVKINRVAPFYLDESIYDQENLKKVNECYYDYKKKYAEILIERKTKPHFSQSRQELDQLYQNFVQARSKRNHQYKVFGDNFIKKKKQETDQKLFLDIFVTFRNTQSKELLQRLHQRQGSILFNLPCFKKRDYFVYRNQQNYCTPIIIEPAAEPEDVKWIFMSRSTLQIIGLNILSFVITFVIMCLSFLITLGLSGFKQSQKGQKDVLSFLLSLLISGIIPGLNFVISIILNILTKLERHTSNTHEQNSIGFKTVVATLINIILIPIAMGFFKANLFGIEGLADDVFFIALTNAFLSPFLMFVNPGFWFSKLKYWWNTRQNKKLYLCQKQLNIMNEKTEFSLGTSYASIITLYLFTCFFVSAQPIVVVFAIIGLFLYSYAAKYNLYKRSKRPIPGSNHITFRKFLFLAIGPLFYAMGSFFWVSWVGNNQVDTLPNILAIILSVVAFVLPYKEISKRIPNNFDKLRIGVYEKDKQKFPYQYENLNPLTAKQKPRQGTNEKNVNKGNHENSKSNPSKQQNLGGVSVSNNSDKLKIAQFFEDIEGGMISSILRPDSRPNSQKKQERFEPIKIYVNQKYVSAYPDQQDDSARRKLMQYPNQRAPPVVHLEEGKTIHHILSPGQERVYIISSGNQVNNFSNPQHL